MLLDFIVRLTSAWRHLLDTYCVENSSENIQTFFLYVFVSCECSSRTHIPLCYISSTEYYRKSLYPASILAKGHFILLRLKHRLYVYARLIKDSSSEKILSCFVSSTRSSQCKPRALPSLSVYMLSSCASSSIFFSMCSSIESILETGHSVLWRLGHSRQSRRRKFSSHYSSSATVNAGGKRSLREFVREATKTRIFRRQ